MRAHRTPPAGASSRTAARGAARAADSAVRLHAVPDSAEAVLLFLHGGRSEDLRPVSRWSLAAGRMSALRRSVGRRTSGSFVLASVRYRRRGWNGDRADAAADAARALTELTEPGGPGGPGGRAGGLPIVLVGHSMGARAALRCAGHPRVAAVVALAPWCPPDEPTPRLRPATRVFLVHGDRDRVTSPADTRAYAERLGPAARALVVPGGGHAMLRRAGMWSDLTALLVGHCAADPVPGGPWKVDEEVIRRGLHIFHPSEPPAAPKTG